MKRVFIPVDLSAASFELCKYAVQIVEQEACTLFIYHIYPDQLMVPDSSFPAGIDNDAFMNTAYIGTLKERSLNELSILIKQLEKVIGDKPISLESEVIGGDLEWQIMECGERLRPDLIIMGTKGKGNKGLLEGGTAKKIMNESNIPVIVLPESYKEKPLKNIMYACDQCPEDFPKIKMLFKLFDALDVKVFVTHLCLKDEDKDKRIMSDLKKLFAIDQSKGRIYFHLVDTDDKESALQAFTELNEIDLIAFIAHRKSFLKKFFQNKIHKEDFFKLEIPMLAVHNR